MYHLNNEDGRAYTGIKEYLIESDEDVVDLPVDIAPGSCALNMSNGTLWFLHHSESGNVWKQMITN